MTFSKTAVFTTLNFYLPAQGVMPMHCSANVGKSGDVASLQPCSSSPSLVVAAGVLFHGGWAVFAIVALRIEIASRRKRASLIAMG
jgi:phosphoenolpyruvate carboxykinase-like protein